MPSRPEEEGVGDLVVIMKMDQDFYLLHDANRQVDPQSSSLKEGEVSVKAGEPTSGTVYKSQG